MVMPVDLATVTYTSAGGIARVALNRPAQLNAISGALLEDLARVCDAVDADRAVRVVTLTANGRAFCAGADLKVVGELALDPDRWSAFMRLWHTVFIGDQHANFGLVAGGGGSQRLPRLVGARRAKELMMLGGWLSAAEAREWGLVNRVVPPGTVAAAVEEIAAALAAKSRSANATVKTLVNGAGADLATGLEREIRLVAAHMRSKDAAEGLAAFTAKRTPVFTD